MKDLEHDLDELRKVVIGLQESHIKLQKKIYGKESKEIHEEEKKCIVNGCGEKEECYHCHKCQHHHDVELGYKEEKNWKLTDHTESTKKGICQDSEYCYIEDFKTFLRKVKEDKEREVEEVKRTDYCEERIKNAAYKDGIRFGMSWLMSRIKKRAGRL